MERKLLIHIGYHKTATTWMQNKLFTESHGYKQIAGHKDVFNHIVNPHGLSFSPEPMRTHIATAYNALPDGYVPVISSELLCGHPFFGGRESDIYAERLKAIAPDARILISIRAQQKILPSVYMQYILRGGTMPPAQFFRDENDLGYFSFSSKHFEYHLLVGLYQSLFGAENVHVITQESLLLTLDDAVATLAEFCCNQAFTELHPDARVPHPPSYPEYAAAVLRRINHIQKSTLNPAPIISLGETPRGLYKLAGYMLRKPPLKTLLGHSRPVSTYVRARFYNRFTDSNAKLSQLMRDRLNLSGYD